MNIGLGTAAIGRPQYINIRASQENNNFNKNAFIYKGKQILSQAYQNGVRHFDTAPGYGIAEQILLEWIQENNPQDIFVSTKWGYTYVADFDPTAKIHEIKEHSLSKLNKQWKYSSQLLPHINIYQIHSATLDSGVLENTAILNRLFELKQTYQIEIGLSTSGANQNEIIAKALELEVNGVELFDVFQTTFNIFDQSLLELKSTLETKQKKIIIKEALANGRIFPSTKYEHYTEIYEVLNTLAQKYQVGVDAIALRFCIDVLNPYLVLSGVVEQEHLLSNLKANTIKLSEEELNHLRELAIIPEDYWQERKQLIWN